MCVRACVCVCVRVCVRVSMDHSRAIETSLQRIHMADISLQTTTIKSTVQGLNHNHRSVTGIRSSGAESCRALVAVTGPTLQSKSGGDCSTKLFSVIILSVCPGPDISV